MILIAIMLGVISAVAVNGLADNLMREDAVPLRTACIPHCHYCGSPRKFRGLVCDPLHPVFFRPLSAVQRSPAVPGSGRGSRFMARFPRHADDRPRRCARHAHRRIYPFGVRSFFRPRFRAPHRHRRSGRARISRAAVGRPDRRNRTSSSHAWRRIGRLRDLPAAVPSGKTAFGGIPDRRGCRTARFWGRHPRGIYRIYYRLAGHPACHFCLDLPRGNRRFGIGRRDGAKKIIAAECQPWPTVRIC